MKEELQGYSLNELVAEGLQKGQQVDIAALKSSNLCGKNKGLLRNGAMRMQVILDIIRSRAD